MSNALSTIQKDGLILHAATPKTGKTKIPLSGEFNSPNSPTHLRFRLEPDEIRTYVDPR